MLTAPPVLSSTRTDSTTTSTAFVTRSLTQLDQNGLVYNQLKEHSTSEEWMAFLDTWGEEYVLSCIAIHESLSELKTVNGDLGDRLLALPFHFFPAIEGARLLKQTPDVLEKCVAKLQSEITHLSDKSLKEVIKEIKGEHRPTVKNKVGLEETLTPEMVEKI